LGLWPAKFLSAVILQIGILVVPESNADLGEMRVQEIFAMADTFHVPVDNPLENKVQGCQFGVDFRIVITTTCAANVLGSRAEFVADLVQSLERGSAVGVMVEDIVLGHEPGDELCGCIEVRVQREGRYRFAGHQVRVSSVVTTRALGVVLEHLQVVLSKLLWIGPGLVAQVEHGFAILGQVLGASGRCWVQTDEKEKQKQENRNPEAETMRAHAISWVMR